MIWEEEIDDFSFFSCNSWRSIYERETRGGDMITDKIDVWGRRKVEKRKRRNNPKKVSF